MTKGRRRKGSNKEGKDRAVIIGGGVGWWVEWLGEDGGWLLGES